MKTLGQILSIILTEIRFGLRRGIPLAIVVVLGVLIIFGTLVYTNAYSRDIRAYLNAYPMARQVPGNQDMPTPSAMMSLYFGGGLFNAWPSFLILSLVGLTMATSSTISADRQFGVAELIRSTPISGLIYLTGKIMGVIINVFVAAFIMLLLYILTIRVMFGPPNIGLLFRLTLFDGVPVLIFASILGTLVGVPLRKRNVATVVGLFVGIFSLICWLIASQEPLKLMVIDIFAYYAFQSYLWPIFLNLPHVEITAVVTMYICVFIIILFIFILARLWFLWKENF